MQFTLDKLEGRIRVTPEGNFRRVGFENPALDDVCGLMSMLGNGLVDTGEGVEENQFGDRMDYHALSDWTDGPMDEWSSGFGDPAYDDSSFYGSNESDGIRWMATEGVATEVSRNITHPAFSWSPYTEGRWETSSRVSEDSLFDGHTRCPPEPKPNATCKALGRPRYSRSFPVRGWFPVLTFHNTSPPSTTTIPPYRDSLCSKILGDTWPRLHTRLASPEDVPFVDNSNIHFEEPNESRALSYVPPFDPRSTTFTQARTVFQGKSSFMKKIINTIAHPMKMLTSRDKKQSLVYESRNPSEKDSRNYRASSYPSGSTKDARKKVVFNDTVGYRGFREDPLYAEAH